MKMNNHFGKLLIIMMTIIMMVIIAVIGCATSKNIPENISVTVTGIPEEYKNSMLMMSFRTGANPEIDKILAVGGCIELGLLTEDWWTFEMNVGNDGSPGLPRFNKAGHYTVLLFFYNIETEKAVGLYMTTRDIAAGVNVIPYSEFSPTECPCDDCTG